MKKARLALLNVINDAAFEMARDYISTGAITQNIIKTIIELYASAKVEQVLKDDFFEAAYHTPITGELEFLISRILYHYSASEHLNWKILLRRQEKNNVPDIRIIKNCKNISIIEIKAKGGWIQPFLSKERFDKDMEKLTRRKSDFDPQQFIKVKRQQLNKYQETFGLEPDSIFFFIPTLAAVHRKYYKASLSDYLTYFETVSGLQQSNLVLLSSNLRLELANKKIDMNDLCPTIKFEEMLTAITKKSSKF